MLSFIYITFPKQKFARISLLFLGKRLYKRLSQIAHPASENIV